MLAIGSQDVSRLAVHCGPDRLLGPVTDDAGFRVVADARRIIDLLAQDPFQLGEKPGDSMGIMPEVSARARATADTFPAVESAVLEPVAGGCGQDRRIGERPVQEPVGQRRVRCTECKDLRSNQLDPVLVIGCQQQDLVAPATQDHVEMFENIAPEDAQVCSSRVDERGELASDVGGTAVISGQFKHGPDQHKTTRPADSLKAQARRCRGRRKSEARQEVRAEDCAISTGIDQKRLDMVGPVVSLDLGP